MAAFDLEERERTLRDLRVDGRSDLGLAILAMGAAVAATILHPPFVMPLFAAALVGLALAGRAFFRRLELVDRLLLERGAHAIPEIRREAERLASMPRRRALAQSLRTKLTPPEGYPMRERILAAADELRALADDLENEELSLDPLSAAECNAFLNDHEKSPLLNDLLPEGNVRSWIRRIRFGFELRAGSLEG